ncbi:MAG: chromate transporter [Chloroflexi bacterium]|nr:chromate transporter [Chloroflexota bacterium]
MRRESAAESAGAPATVSLAALFGCFVEITFSSFGGAVAWAYRILVEKRQWLTAREFAELWSLGQALPGPNIVNVAIFIGARFHGALGALVAFTGLILAPLVVWVPLGALYSEVGQFDAVRAVLRGVAVVAAGLLLATGLKMAQPARRDPRALIITALAFVGVGVLHWPLLLVLLLLAPVSIALVWRQPS